MWVLTVVILIYLFIYVSIIIIIIIIIVLFLFFLGGGHCKRLPGLLGANFHGRCLDFQRVKTLVLDGWWKKAGTIFIKAFPIHSFRWAGCLGAN